jgi:hypothetical protein
MRRKLIHAIAAAALLAVPMQSFASAYGYQYWGGFNFEGLRIPGGQLYHAIQGKGRHIDVEGANFGAAGNLCDSSVRFTYGNGAQHVDSDIHRGCSHVGQWKYRMNMNVPGGQACAELWVQNWRKKITKQCHYVSG